MLMEPIRAPAPKLLCRIRNFWNFQNISFLAWEKFKKPLKFFLKNWPIFRGFLNFSRARNEIFWKFQKYHEPIILMQWFFYPHKGGSKFQSEITGHNTCTKWLKFLHKCLFTKRHNNCNCTTWISKKAEKKSRSIHSNAEALI